MCNESLGEAWDKEYTANNFNEYRLDNLESKEGMEMAHGKIDLAKKALKRVQKSRFIFNKKKKDGRKR